MLVILEHAVLQIKPDRGRDFEVAFSAAKSIISSTPGFQRLTLSRCIERGGTYLLLVEWDRVEDHTEGFRQSPQYEQWRRLLHDFYDPFPSVEHYARIDTA